MLKRVLGGLLASAALAGAFLAPSYLGRIQFPQLGQVPSGLLATVKARDLTLVCPGAAFATGGQSGTSVSSFARTGTATVNYSSNLPAGVTLKAVPLEGPAASFSRPANSANSIATIGTVSSVAVTVEDPAGAAQQSSTLFTAQSFQALAAAGIKGVLAANCQNPEPESWLVGGVTTVGREALLIMANPTQTDATVSLRLWGEQGLIDGAGLNGISVSANRTVVLPLAGFAPDQKALAVQVVSSGAPLATWIQERTTRGTLSAGADLLSPSIPAANNLVIPGLLKRGTKDAQAMIASNPDYQDLTPSIQVFNPGVSDASVTVQVIGSDAKSLGTVLQQTVSAGSVGAFDLAGLGDGDYSVFVGADQPVMAGVKLSRTNPKATPSSDFAWLPAVAPMSIPVALTTPKSGVTKVSIANGGNAIATVQVSGNQPAGAQTIAVQPLGSRVLALPAGSVVSVSASQPVSATMISDFTGQLTALGFVDYRNSGGKLSVSVR
ncbi:MAG: DUF5719 family protein [Micrococcales bacterium]